MSTPAQKHIVAFTVEAWGNSITLFSVIVDILSLRRTRSSPGQLIRAYCENAPVGHHHLFDDGYFYQRVKTELSRSFDEGDEEAASRIR